LPQAVGLRTPAMMCWMPSSAQVMPNLVIPPPLLRANWHPWSIRIHLGLPNIPHRSEQRFHDYVGHIAGQDPNGQHYPGGRR
jgi:hypothetical protein